MKTITLQGYKDLQDRAIKAHAERTGLSYPRAMLDLVKTHPGFFEQEAKIRRITKNGKQVLEVK